MSRRDAAELVCRSEENETDASSLGERVDNILALWDAMGHQDYCRLDAGLKNMDWIKILGALGLQVAEPVSQDPSESFVHCILQWLLREELILPPLEEEEQRKIVSHILKRSSRSVFGFAPSSLDAVVRCLYDGALYSAAQGNGDSMDNYGAYFLFDKERFDREPRALATYEDSSPFDTERSSLMMCYRFLKGEFPRASLHPHPARKNVTLLHRFDGGSWALMSCMPRKKADFPIEVAAQGLLRGMSRVSEDETRGVHQPLLVLPQVIFVDSQPRAKSRELSLCAQAFGTVYPASFSRCLSCNVCDNCLGDTFVRYLDGPRPCKCWTAKCDKTAECDHCHQPLTRQHFADSRWHHRHEEGRRMICLRCSEAPKLQPCVVCEVQQSAEHYTDSMWHHRKEQPAVCKKCQAANVAAVHPCAVCGLQQPRQGYDPSMWSHRTQRPATCTQCVAAKS